MGNEIIRNTSNRSQSRQDMACRSKSSLVCACLGKSARSCASQGSTVIMHEAAPVIACPHASLLRWSQLGSAAPFSAMRVNARFAIISQPRAAGHGRVGPRMTWRSLSGRGTARRGISEHGASTHRNDLLATLGASKPRLAGPVVSSRLTASQG